MSKKIFSIKTLLSLCAVVCLSLATVFLCVPKQTTAKADGGEIVTDVVKMEYFSEGDALILYLENTDYMTATEWGTDSTEAYKWLWDGQLSIEDKENYNMPNALLDKNLDAYNFGEYILIDGVPLKDYNYTLMANKFTRVHTLGITVDAGVMANAKEIAIQEGCTIPTLHHSYFGVEEYSALVIEEGLVFHSKNGVWVKTYAFDGYETGVMYDGCEKYLYARAVGSTYKGHLEAATYEFTTALAGYGWADEGYSLASTADTDKGSLLVYEFVNPINANEIGLITLRLYSNVARTFVSYNANEVTEDDLGPVLEMYSTSGGFSTITLLSSLYANAEGMVETLVFQFTADGDKNQLFLASFTLGENTINTDVYDDSCFIQDLEDCYDLTFRFNKKGTFNGEEKLDTSKVLINGVSVDEINAKGDYAQAEWNSVQGIYQINVRLNKDYEGAGQLKNADLGFTGNNMTVVEGLAFPSGETLDCTYTCHIYAGEKFVDYELLKDYKETSATNLTWIIDRNSADNIHLYLEFDQVLSSQIYYHASQIESWREESLILFKGMYDADFTKVYIAGGFKSSLYDNILINGKTLGEWHATDTYATCLFVHYGQASSYILDISVDSRSQSYTDLLPLFESGEGVTLEVKEGLKFTTGIRTEKDYQFVLQNGKFVQKGYSKGITVYYNGKPVSNGDTFVSATEALSENIAVVGVDGYAITQERNGDVVSFTINAEGAEPYTFNVKEEIVNEDTGDEGKQNPLTGCTASVSCVSAMMGGMLLLVSAVPVMIRRKKDEE